MGTRPSRLRSSASRRTLVGGLRPFLMMLCLSGFTTGQEENGGSTAAVRPNIVLLLLDDVGTGDLGCYGSATIRTPRIDALAVEGTRFTQFYACGAVCTPTRLSILTGQYPIRFGVHDVFSISTQRGIPAEVPILPEMLAPQGYVSAHVGKWHVGTWRPEFQPENRGFARVVQYSGGYVDPQLRENGAGAQREAGHLTSLLTDRAIEFVRAHRDEPFFLNLWFHAAHTPLEPVAHWAEQYPDTERGRFAAVVSYADEQIGRLVDVLDELGLTGRTLILVTSDNGPMKGEDSSSRGSKAFLFEAGIRVPLIARWPGQVAAGAVNRTLAASLDFFPTLAEVSGLDPATLSAPGTSLLATLRDGQERPRTDSLCWETRQGYAVRSGSWKLIQYGEHDQLYNLEGREAEGRDVAAANPEVVAALTADHRRWRREHGRLPHQVARCQGTARLDEDGSITLTGGGGAVRLAPSTRFDVHDGDFTMQAHVVANRVGEKAWIAGRKGSWQLLLDASARLVLVVQDEDGTRRSLTGSRRLEVGSRYHVAFTVRGTRKNGSEVRLYLDGDEQARQSVSAMHGGDAPVEIGRMQGATLDGTVSDLSFYCLALEPRELDVD